ncbi:hypothetical protein W911_09740 [Hyphomicrobium nitrativorans NL23]|uniref:Lipoprotein n=2 Tax=Hyphomicrobium TaxID=81 RepID=V5SF74_9HYPH|nr:hypothetical protein W911_09740 [Hyphomicrobium nitrativorans NL23]
MTLALRSHLTAALAALLLGACASQGNDLTTSSLGPAPQPASASQLSPSLAPVAQTVSRLPAEGGYQLTAAERDMDCRALTGRTAVRIMQLRDYENRRQASLVSRAVQSTTSAVFFGGTGAGLDPDGRHRRERAQLVAYNGLLAEKQCANFDLDAELKPGAKEPPRTRPSKRT